MTAIVITQPMHLPWRGFFEHVHAADIVVLLDDVQLPRGRSFITRVQIKTEHSERWLTAPVKRAGRSIQRIDRACFDGDNWRREHLARIESAHRRAPHFQPFFDEVVRPIIEHPANHLADHSVNAIRRISAILDIDRMVVRSSQLPISPATDASQRLLDICLLLEADEYITGHGAINYLDHERFEHHGVDVRYMDYALTEYPQLHGAFNPYVSIIDLLLNTGPDAASHLHPATIGWRAFAQRQNTAFSSAAAPGSDA
jgi:hypothetical protein